jgi:hypothetical protein
MDYKPNTGSEVADTLIDLFANHVHKNTPFNETEQPEETNGQDLVIKGEMTNLSEKPNKRKGKTTTFTLNSEDLT